MSQTTMKVDRDVLEDLRFLATQANRSPQKHLRFLVNREKSKRSLADIEQLLTPEQQERADAVRLSEASEALEGYQSMSEIGGYGYELQKKWILGEITTEERSSLIKKHYGLD